MRSGKTDLQRRLQEVRGLAHIDRLVKEREKTLANSCRHPYFSMLNITKFTCFYCCLLLHYSDRLSVLQWVTRHQWRHAYRSEKPAIFVPDIFSRKREYLVVSTSHWLASNTARKAGSVKICSAKDCNLSFFASFNNTSPHGKRPRTMKMVRKQ